MCKHMKHQHENEVLLFYLKTITTETNQTIALKAAHSFKFEHIKISTLL